MPSFIALYRLRHGHKISSLRLMGYVVFGFAISGVFNARLYIFDAVTVFFGLLSASYFNDYYDWLSFGETNTVSRAKHKSIFFGVLPAFIATVLLGFFYREPITLMAYSLLWVSFVLSIFYNLPPLRLKERVPLGLVAPPLGIFFLFLQALSLMREPDTYRLAVAAIVFLFAWYMEALHLIDDSLENREVKKLSTAQSVFLLRAVALMGVGVGIVFSFISPLFIASIYGWSARAHTIFRKNPKELAIARRRILSPIWRLEEFVIYAAVGMMELYTHLS